MVPQTRDWGELLGPRGEYTTVCMATQLVMMQIKQKFWKRTSFKCNMLISSIDFETSYMPKRSLRKSLNAISVLTDKMLLFGIVQNGKCKIFFISDSSLLLHAKPVKSALTTMWFPRQFWV